ncbi:MAG: peroxiredoxin [Proteobacteria bacterium]|nr:peroxiredoxin [Pseudomonadota bacterium]MCZ6785065.1 peroxiredoxin [Pseudomonadota bacterium]
MASPGVGDVAPDFTLPSTEGEITLSDRLKDRAVLLVFYPGDDTAVCTRQLCDYRDNLSAFSDLGADILALNPQSLSSHERFAEKHGLSFPLLADEDKSVCRSYGALGLLGMAKRALVLIGRDGRVVWKKTDLPIFHRSAQELQEILRDLEL